MNLQISIPKLYHCVNKCPFCIVNTHKTTEFNALDVVAWGQKLNVYLFNNRYSVEAVVITGENEPLQQAEYVIEAIKVCSKYKIPIEFTTTGALFTESFKDRRIRKAFKKVKVFNISTLGNVVGDYIVTKKENNTFDAVAKLIKKKTKALVRINLLETKWASYTDFMSLLMNEDVDQITIKHLQGNNAWIKRNKTKSITTGITNQFDGKLIKIIGNFKVYEVAGKSIYVDSDCNNGEQGERYEIFRADGDIYSSWESCVPKKLEDMERGAV